MNKKMKFMPVLLAGLLLNTYCASTSANRKSGDADTLEESEYAVAVLHPTQGSQVKGVVRFIDQGNNLRIVARLEGLTPGLEQGFHIHQEGDCRSPDGKSAGGHYNPGDHPHALPPTTSRHAGDLGNVIADGQGVANYEITVSNLTIARAKNPVLGRGVIVHSEADDGGQPTGNAGARMACGVIGLASPEE